MPNLWWYADGGSQRGPIHRDEMNHLILEGKVSSETMLWREGLADWVQLSRLDESEGLIRSVPPPLAIPGLPPEPVVARSGRRFFARMIDLWIISSTVAFLGGFGLSLASDEFAFWIQQPGTGVIFMLLVVFPISFAIDAALYALLGNTLGKKLFSLEVSTTDLKPLTFGQYLLRNFGVWWYGLAAGFPILSLLTMIYQQRRVSRGEATGYDIGKYRVNAKPRSRVREAIAILLFVGLAVGLTAINVWDQQQNRSMAIGSTWINPITLSKAAVPPGWLASQEKNDQGQPIYTFTAPTEYLIAVFAMEENPHNITLARYFALFVEAVANAMIIEPNTTPQTLHGRQVLVSEGHLTQDPNRKLQITFVASDQQLWRFVAISGSGRNINAQKATELRSRLFGTLSSP